jgi:hypothetical protein
MNDTIREILSTLLTVLVFVGLPLAGIVYSVKLSYKNEQKRDEMLRRLLGDDVQIKRGFPIDQKTEEIIQGGIRNTIQKYRELLVGGRWVFVQMSSRVSVFTLFEDRTLSTLGLYAYSLNEFTPTIVIRNTHNKSFLARFIQEDLKNKTLIWCESAYDKDHNVYNQPGAQLDTLSILSPEVLEVLRNAPGNADILLKRNQLYYMLPGGLSSEKILPSLIEHGTRAAVELDDNLRRWSSAPSNQAKLNEIKSSELSVTLREQFERNL